MATEEEVKLAEKLNQLEKDRESSIEKQLEFANALNGLSEQQVAKLLKQQNISAELKKALQQVRDTAQKTTDYYQKQVESLKEAKDRLDKIIASEKDRYKNSVLMEERNKLARDHRKATIRQLKELAKSEKGITEEQAEQLENLDKLDKKLAKLGDNASDIAQGLFSGDGQAFIKALKGMGGSIKSELTANIKETINGADDLAGGLKAAKGAMGALALVTLAESVLALAVELGDAENAFMKSTGASQEFARSLSVTYEEGRKFTATAKDMGAAMTALYNTFTDFSTIQDAEVRNSLIKTTAVLEKFGVSNQQTAQGIQTLTKGMGMNAEAAGAEMLNMVGFAQELGVAPEALAGQFGEASDSLMKLGENGDEAFRDLAAAAKVTGLSVSKLLNIVNQFDTFEGAARQAGKLNAALGGNFVNAMDLMMETDPTARFEMIRDSILDTGLSFDTMSYYQKNFYKDALGLDSIGDLALTLSGNMDSVSEETKKTSKDFEEAAKEAKTLASFQDQLNAAFAQMIPILTPLIDAFRGILTFIGENITMFKLLGAVLLVTFGSIPGAVAAGVMLLDWIKVGKDEVSLLSIAFEGVNLAVEGLAEGLSFLWEAFRGDDLINWLKSFTEGADASKDTLNILKGVLGGLAVGLIAVTLPISGTTAAIVGLVAGVAALMKAFSKKNSPSFFDMFTGGMLEQAFDALMIPFRKFEAVITYIGDIFKTIVEAAVAFFNALTDPGAAANIEKIAAAIDGVSRTKALALGSAMADVGTALKYQSMVSDNNVMNKTMATTAESLPAAAARAAAPTAANTNIAQNSSSNTYINSGPENAVIDVRIGDEKLGRVVTKIQSKQAAKAIAGRT